MCQGELQEDGEGGNLPRSQTPQARSWEGQGGAVELKLPIAIISHQFTVTMTPVQTGKARPAKSRPEE